MAVKVTIVLIRSRAMSVRRASADCQAPRIKRPATTDRTCLSPPALQPRETMHADATAMLSPHPQPICLAARRFTGLDTPHEHEAHRHPRDMFSVAANSSQRTARGNIKMETSETAVECQCSNNLATYSTKRPVFQRGGP
jgi:hypothetical protein